MWLALTDLFNAKWTEEIHAEWIRSILLVLRTYNNDRTPFFCRGIFSFQTV
jgi:hypothetical protein